MIASKPRLNSIMSLIRGGSIEMEMNDIFGLASTKATIISILASAVSMAPVPKGH